MKKIDEIIKRVKNLNPNQQEEILEILRAWQIGRQREYQRLETKAEIDVLIGDRVIQTTTRDMSGSGIYINASGNYKTNVPVRIVFNVPGHDKPFKLQGTIVRVDDHGIAVRFSNITKYFKQVLDQIIWAGSHQDDGF